MNVFGENEYKKFVNKKKEEEHPSSSPWALKKNNCLSEVFKEILKNRLSRKPWKY